MAIKLRQCRRSLAAALDRAADEIPAHPSGSWFTVSQNDMNEGFISCSLSTFLQDLCQFLDMRTLEDLVAKLEFENELNRVYSDSVQKSPGSCSEAGENRDCEYRNVEEGSSDHWACGSQEDCSFLLDTIMEIERDYDVTTDCDVSFMEHVLELSP